jgi:hypothetical protein
MISAGELMAHSNSAPPRLHLMEIHEAWPKRTWPSPQDDTA